jgi:hypothetical protein
MATMTGYSLAMGGKAGYVNIGGWNSTITDVSTSPKEVCGVERVEGANSYVYAMAGSGAVVSRGIYMLCTAIADADGNVAPLRMTTVAINALTSSVRPFALAVCTAGTGQYGWYLRRGIFTCYLNTNSAATIGANGIIHPSTATLHAWQCCATSTGFGFLLEEAASSTACSGGVMAYVNFASVNV